MKNSYRFFLIILFLQIIPLCAIANTNHTNNAVKLGSAQLKVLISLTNQGEPQDSTSAFTINNVNIYGVTIPIFQPNGEMLYHRLNRDSLTFKGEIPLERIKEFGLIQIYINDNFIGASPIIFKHNELTEVKVELIDSSISRLIYNETTSDYNISDWDNIHHAIRNSITVNPFMFYPKDRSVYKSSWRDVVKIQTDSIWPAFLNESLKGCIIPVHARDWVMNSLKMRFASQCVMPYVERAKDYDIIVDEPPIEAYDFLDSIDYNPDVFLLAHPLSPQRLFISNIMRFIDGGLEDIGERPVKEWKEYMDRKLAPAMEERPKLLLDLLAGMSYVRQLEEEKPLTPIQIKNINEGFTDDIGKIVLARNEALVARLEKKEKAELRNMTDEAFDLKKFIDENYKGRPVVVDLWNTWCGPCMQAISQSEETKQEFAGSDLVFLYVADDSSPEDEWSRKAEAIGSKQVRVSTDTSAAILKSHNLEGFPSYLFFDRDHNLVHSRTAFPGPRGFRELLLEIARGK